MPESEDNLIALTAQIVSAHVTNNTVQPEQLPQLIRGVYSALGNVNKPEAPPKDPAVPIRSSIRPDAVVCLECGAHFKMLKRHLGTEHKLTPLEYRQKWSLPANYSLTSPDYAKTRSTLAKKIGLGRIGGKASPKRTTARAMAKVPAKRRGRRKKAA